MSRADRKARRAGRSRPQDQTGNAGGPQRTAGGEPLVAGYPVGLPNTPRSAAPDGNKAQGSEVYAGTLTTGFNRFGMPRINTQIIAQYEQNAVLADPVRNLKRLMFKDEPTYTVYGPDGTEEAVLSQVAENLGTQINLYAKAQWCFHDRVFGGCTVFSCGWEKAPVRIGDKDVEMTIPKEVRHLPWNSFWQQPPGYMTVYNPIMPGIVVDREMKTHVFQAIDQFVDLGSVGGTQSGLYHLVEIWPRHPKEGTSEAADLASWLASPTMNKRPELTGPTCFKIVKDPSAQDPAGLPDCLPLIPLVAMYDHANQAENQRMNRVGAPLIFPYVEKLTANNKQYMEAFIAKWGKDTGFLMTDGMTLLDPHITDTAVAADRMSYLKDLISSYFNPGTPLKQATGGNSLGKSDTPAADMINGYINNTLSWIEDGFEDIFDETWELNGYHGYTTKIEFPRASQKNDTQIATELDTLAKYGQITGNEMRTLMPNLDLPEDEQFAGAVKVQAPKGTLPDAMPPQAAGSVGNLQNPVQKTEAYTDSLDKLTAAIRKAKADVLGAVRESYPVKNEVGNVAGPSGWTYDDKQMKWTHKGDAAMFVQVIPQGTGYNILHTHPAPGGQVVMQPVQHTENLASAQEAAQEHLNHWSDPKAWESDQDYGKMGA